jgi:hypothetical protein
MFHFIKPYYKMIKTGRNSVHGYALPAMLFILFLFLCSLPSTGLHAQNDTRQDSTVVKLHSPTKAAVFSAVLPGLGQAYNKKYWKIPIVYAGLGLLTYFVINNTREYKKYQEAYNYVASGDSTDIDNDLVGTYDEQQLLDGKNYYRRNMELSYIIGGLWYILNIIDASVDAHFFDYDISEDLSIRFDPIVRFHWQDAQAIPEIKLTINF